MEPIVIDITILKPIEKVWDYFITSKHILKWNILNSSWECVKAENDFKVGGRFLYRMEMKNKGFGFDYKGTFDEIEPLRKINYHLDDGRKVNVTFEKLDEATTKIVQIYEPEGNTSREMQREGWYNILNNFHKYVEQN